MEVVVDPLTGQKTAWSPTLFFLTDLTSPCISGSRIDALSELSG